MDKEVKLIMCPRLHYQAQFPMNAVLENNVQRRVKKNFQNAMNYFTLSKQ